jgi:hypothetical protein
LRSIDCDVVATVLSDFLEVFFERFFSVVSRSFFFERFYFARFFSRPFFRMIFFARFFCDFALRQLRHAKAASLLQLQGPDMLRPAGPGAPLAGLRDPPHVAAVVVQLFLLKQISKRSD